MADSTLPARKSKRRQRWMYLVFAFATLCLLLVVTSFAGALWLSAPLFRALIPEYVGTPDISARVVDAVTGEPVPGMDVCLLETYLDGAKYSVRTRRGEVTQTDASGTFSFGASKARLDWFQTGDRYAISITDPAAGDVVCGTDFQTALEGHGRLFQNEPSASRVQRLRHYFPVAIVNDPSYPPPLPPGTDSFRGLLPGAALFRKIGDPAHIRIELIPLLPNGSECQSAYDASTAALCQEANGSQAASDLRRMLTGF